MADKIGDVMIAISEDPASLQRYKNNKDAELANFDLTQAQKNTIKSGNSKRIRDAIKAESGPDAVVVFWEA